MFFFVLVFYYYAIDLIIILIIIRYLFNYTIIVFREIENLKTYFYLSICFLFNLYPKYINLISNHNLGNGIRYKF